MSSKANILIIEDEEAIRAGLVDVLIYHGFTTDSAADGNSGLEKALTGKFDLILLDVMLPGMDGFAVCEHIRKEDREQPIIMLTAKTSDEDIIQGLQLGADDYVAKPFSIAQLILRIQAVLRRSGITQETAHIIELSNDIKIDTRNLSTIKNNEDIHFTRREMDILLYLFNHADRPVPRDELLNKLWGYAKNLDLETRTVDIHIAKLRRKIEQDPAKPCYLITVRGAGYRLMVS
ncbi:MAG: response regulator transcription factor [Gammaproteobacteria bacterium]|nr:response regulator transcription factor [Gammaproteobacteria bacterium]